MFIARLSPFIWRFFFCNCSYRCNRRRRARPLLMLILPSKHYKRIRSAWKESRFPFPLKPKLNPQICWIKKIVKKSTLMHLPKSWKLQAPQQKHRFMNVFLIQCQIFCKIHFSAFFKPCCVLNSAEAVSEVLRYRRENCMAVQKIGFYHWVHKDSKVEVQNLLVLLSIDNFIANIRC